MLIDELLQAYENPRVDFKRSVDTNSADGVVSDVVAFANTAGGSIVIGVDDERHVVGVDDPQSVEEMLSQKIYDRTEPTLVPSIGITTYEHKELLIIDVQFFQGPEPVAMRTKKGGLVAYERVGSTSQPVSDERLAQLRRERQGRSGFDQLPCKGARLEDLDLEAIRAAFAERDIEIDEPKLQSFELVAKQNAKLVPTNAGIVLFGREPQRVLPDARFRCIRYPGADKGGEALDRADYEGVPLLKAIGEAETFIARNTGLAQAISKSKRRDIPHYHPLVLREILYNAVAHADYSQTGSRLNVSIYADRMEIDSPGPMPAGMSVDQLRAGISRIRNRAIARIMNALGYIEEHGTVFAKALQAEQEGYPLPEWTQPGHIVRVTLRPHSSAQAGSAIRRRRVTPEDHKVAIRAFLSKRRDADAEELAAQIGVGKRRVQQLLTALGEEIETVFPPHHPDQRYRLRKRK